MSHTTLDTAPEQRHTPRRQARGVARREKIIQAAVELIRHEGPGVVTHRAVAAKAGVPLAATTYYFDGLDDLMGAAGAIIVEGWAEHAKTVAERLVDAPKMSPHRIASTVVDAILPPGNGPETRGFYEHLVLAGRYPTLARAYADGRDRLDAVIADLLAGLGVEVDAALLIAVVDGAAISALSENHESRGLAVSLVEKLIRAEA